MTILLAALLVVVLILIFAGHSIGNFAIEQINQIRSKDKAVCTINPENATQIVYEGTTYQILNETVDSSKIGGWNGVFRKIVILDDHYRVLNQVKVRCGLYVTSQRTCKAFATRCQIRSYLF